MATDSSHAPSYDVERATSYSPIPGGPAAERPRTKKVFASILFSSFVLLSLILLIINLESNQPRVKLNETSPENTSTSTHSFFPARPLAEPPSRGVTQGVSEKVFQRVSGLNLSFAWTNSMLAWQRTAYHFQPEKNWMNDPDGKCFKIHQLFAFS
ncbi:Beta-fructofuranosidase [Handroanthus impetiginosus]|uniref:beta-fructofuranosidase n=1 Tax=Handroanthus impetiginosus TaxID=429701 RepID=A0A2G9GJF6_9LAMI|nr:Beta-fructofuranosidase [Handroanthus impetiginosus]